MKDVLHNVIQTQILNPATTTTTKTSSAIDMMGFNSLIVLFSIGQSLDTLSGSLYWTLKLTESDDNSTYTDVAASDIFGGSATVVINSSSLDRTSYMFNYNGIKRYVKAVATPTGSHSVGTPIGMISIKGTPHVASTV